MFNVFVSTCSVDFCTTHGKINEFGWCDLERISADARNQFTSTDFKEECQNRGVHLRLAAPEHQEMNGKVEMTWRMLRTIAHSIMVHAIVLEAYIHFALIYTTYRIFPVLTIKDLVNEDGNPTTPFKLATGTKSSITWS